MYIYNKLEEKKKKIGAKIGRKTGEKIGGRINGMKARKIAQNIYKISKGIEREIGRKEGV